MLDVVSREEMVTILAEGQVFYQHLYAEVAKLFPDREEFNVQMRRAREIFLSRKKK